MVFFIESFRHNYELEEMFGASIDCSDFCDILDKDKSALKGIVDDAYNGMSMMLEFIEKND